METITPTAAPTGRFFTEALLCRLLRVVFNWPTVLPADQAPRQKGIHLSNPPDG